MKKILLQLLILPVFLSSTLEILKTIANTNLINAKKELYDCFKKYNLYLNYRKHNEQRVFSEIFDNYINTSVKDMCSNKLKPLNLSGNVRIKFYSWGRKDNTLEFKDFKNSDNCFDDFNLHLFAATEPQMILNDEKLQKKVDQNWSIAVETLYNCFIHLGLHEGYHYEKVFDKITLNNKDKYSNNIGDYKTIIMKYKLIFLQHKQF
ncbi:uncharacterized protein LOC126909416 [Daktulosphaira vitifoliae]|uniref:uncharacterized protein LOC126909416 n=1 Tax=Daktulosphaira vitifoliae TaxID=58002 RepID=UPI0021A9B725|nr:uncharacterized protein LOC126909416 [Daktulosphaira vitifoliae]